MVSRVRVFRRGRVRRNRDLISGRLGIIPEKWSISKPYILCSFANSNQDPGAVPTLVGVNQLPAPTPPACRGCPHACGGEPWSGDTVLAKLALSPRLWG